LGGGRAKAGAEAYRGVYEMQRNARNLALWPSLSASVSVFRGPQDNESSGDPYSFQPGHCGRRLLSARARKNPTEIGELAETFNVMSEELEHFVLDLKRAPTRTEIYLWAPFKCWPRGRRKRSLHRGHSDRVTRYSIMIAKEMGVSEDFIELCASPPTA